MLPLGAEELISLWERGQTEQWLDRALTLAGAARPEPSRAALGRLGIGRRDAILLELYRRSFGATLRGLVRCPRCAETVTLTLDTAELLGVHEAAEEDVGEGVWEGIRVRFRAPTSLDVALAVRAGDLVSGRRLILRHTVLEASRDGAALAPEELPETVLAALIAAMAEHDALAETMLEVACPACEHTWEVLFDIVPLLWHEVRQRGVRLLDEVHRIAAAYGWREEEILALSPRRRQFYLERIEA